MSAASSTPRLARDRATRAADHVTRIAGAVGLALIVVLLLVPPLLVAVISFGGQSYFEFPPTEWSLRQYRTLVEQTAWGSAIWLSVKIAVPAAVLSAVLAVPAVLAIERSRLPGRQLINVAGLTSLVIPIVAYAVAMYGVFSDVGLLGSYWGLVLANTILALPYMLVTVSAAMSAIPADLELAAMTMGAGRMRAWSGITLRLLTPAVLAGSLLAFISSFDEAVFINFLAGPGQVTLSKAIFDSVRVGVDPVITAVSTLLMVATSLLMLLSLRLRKA